MGFPYSDPIADGPVIQESYTRALGKKVRLQDIFAGLATLKGEKIPPLLAMVAYAIVYRAGPAQVRCGRRKQAGFSGLIVPDLPGDQAAELFAIARSQGLDFVQLVAPTTTPDRVERILQIEPAASCTASSVAGTTGVREALPDELRTATCELGQKTKLPLAVGFGIGRPEQIESLRGRADGVIVGSAIVRHVGRLNGARKHPARQC